MSSKHRLTRSFRTLSALLYLSNTVVSFKYAVQPDYLSVLVGSLIGLMCLIMLCVSVEAPRLLVSKLELTKVGELLFSFRGRYMADLLIALFLFAMGGWGIMLGVFTLFLIFGIRFLGVKHPDAFNEIFRQSDIESQSEYTLESEYDNTIPSSTR